MTDNIAYNQSNRFLVKFPINQPIKHFILLYDDIFGLEFIFCTDTYFIFLENRLNTQLYNKRPFLITPFKRPP